MFAAPSNNPIVSLMDGLNKDKTSWYSATDPKTSYAPYNPDDIYQKRGDYSIYEDMMKDDQVSVAMQIKKDLVLGSGWEILCEDENQEHIKKDLETAFNEDFDGSFDDAIMEILSAYEFGFSVTEKQFKKRSDGSLTLNKLKTRDPMPWLFHQDEYGNITRYEQQGTKADFRDIDRNALIHFINNPRFNNPYGTSDLRAAYMAYFIKTQIVRFYAIYLEKAASPVPVGKFDKEVSTQEDVLKVYNLLKKLQTSTAMTIPKDIEIQFLEAKSNGEAFIKGVGLFNMFIGRALFVPDLLGFQGNETGGGSLALGKEQIKIFLKHILRRRNSIENLINNHLVKPIVTWNYGKIENFPKFKLKEIDDDVAERNAKLWLEAVKGQAFKPSLEEINQFKSIISFPESTDEPEPEDPIDTLAQKDVFAQKEDFEEIENLLDKCEAVLIDKAEPLMVHMINRFMDDAENLSIKTVDDLNKLDGLSFKKSDIKKLAAVLDGQLKKSYDDFYALTAKKDDFAIDPDDEFLAILMRENLKYIGDWEYGVNKAARVSILSAIKNGEAIPDVIKILTKKTKEELKVSLERYARTKHTEVMNKARKAYFDKTGIVAAYRFSAIIDGRTSLICRSLDGKIFPANAAPTPPLHFGCRSLLVPITKYEDYKIDDKIEGIDAKKFIDANKGLGF